MRDAAPIFFRQPDAAALMLPLRGYAATPIDYYAAAADFTLPLYATPYAITLMPPDAAAEA
jgi:hypothetical protein